MQWGFRLQTGGNHQHRGTHMKDGLRCALLGAGLLLGLAGCTTLPGAVTGAVNDRRTEYVLTRHEGTTPVVFENGLGATLHYWAKVYPVIAKQQTAYAYNRPGYGRSAPPDTPRDGAHVTAELHAALRAQGLTPPYVLVGHSLGGLYLQDYARRYPDEVRALVLVDSTHPRQMQGEGSPDHWPWWVRALFRGLMSATAKEELAAVNRTGDDVLALPPLTGKTVIVLSATKPLADTSALGLDANAKRRDIARLYPGSRQIWVDSGHGIPLEKPEAVIDAVRAALDGAVAPSP